MKVFIINLKRSLERKRAMDERIKSLFEHHPHLKDALDFEFFEAVDGKDAKDLARFEAYFPKFRFLTFCGRGAGFMLDTELACFASHLELWKNVWSLMKIL